MIKIRNSRIAAGVVFAAVVAGGALVAGPGLAVPAVAGTCPPMPGTCQPFAPQAPPPSILSALPLSALPLSALPVSALPLPGVLGILSPGQSGLSGFGQTAGAGGATCHIVCLGTGHHGNPGPKTGPSGSSGSPAPKGPPVPSGPSTVSGFGQVAAAPVKVNAPVDQLVGTVGAPLINVNLACAAPWNQGGVLGARYNACSTATMHQENGPSSADRTGNTARHGAVSGFGQVAAAPVKVNAPINQLAGTVGAPLININIPCPAPWQQGGLLGSRYNACNTATANQENVASR